MSNGKDTIKEEACAILRHLIERHATLSIHHVFERVPAGDGDTTRAFMVWRSHEPQSPVIIWCDDYPEAPNFSLKIERDGHTELIGIGPSLRKVRKHELEISKALGNL